MAREKIPFQIDRPTFVRMPFTAAGAHYKQEDEFKWKTVGGVAQAKAQQLYDCGYLIHNNEKEIQTQVGDGLEGQSIEELHSLLESINVKVKNNTHSEKAYLARKCKRSTVVGKQIGLIRSWRRNHGELESK